MSETPKAPPVAAARTIPVGMGDKQRGTGREQDGIPVDRWAQAVAAIKGSPRLRESILRSVMSSMAFEGFKVDRERSEALLDRALHGPPLEYPGKE